MFCDSIFFDARQRTFNFKRTLMAQIPTTTHLLIEQLNGLILFKELFFIFWSAPSRASSAFQRVWSLLHLPGQQVLKSFIMVYDYTSGRERNSILFVAGYSHQIRATLLGTVVLKHCAYSYFKSITAGSRIQLGYLSAKVSRRTSGVSVISSDTNPPDSPMTVQGNLSLHL